jgi:acetyl-CoA carboxylase biotin carboxyl carrier protein
MDKKEILEIIDKFSASDIAELEFSEGNLRLVLRKGNTDKNLTSYPIPLTSEKQATRLGVPVPDTLATPEGEQICSPLVATFYAAAGPDSPAFVEAGATVKAGETLCILEAMKMMNHLEAEFDCQITAIHAKSGDMVEYGQPLFTVKRL